MVMERDVCVNAGRGRDRAAVKRVKRVIFCLGIFCQQLNQVTGRQAERLSSRAGARARKWKMEDGRIKPF